MSFLQLNAVVSLARCVSKKKQCVRFLSKNSVEKLYRKINEIEQMKFGEIMKSKVMQKDTIGSKGYKTMQSIDDSCDDYFHFRLEGVSRVFLGTYQNKCYILMFDVNGEVYYEAHK